MLVNEVKKDMFSIAQVEQNALKTILCKQLVMIGCVG